MGWAKSKLKTYFYKCRIILCNALHPSHINNAPLSSRESSSRAQAPPVSYERVATSVSKVACIRGDKCDRELRLSKKQLKMLWLKQMVPSLRVQGWFFRSFCFCGQIWASAFCTKVETHTIRAWFSAKFLVWSNEILAVSSWMVIYWTEKVSDSGPFHLFFT